MDNFKRALLDAEKQLQALVEQRADIDGQIHRVSQLIKQLAAHSGVESDTALSPLIVYENRGLTSGIRLSLKQSGKWKTAAEVRHSLLEFGYNLSNYANSSAVINTTLNRLVPEFIEKDTEHGTSRYRWKNAGDEIIKRGWREINGKK
jgi:hypothetical protein